MNSFEWNTVAREAAMVVVFFLLARAFPSGPQVPGQRTLVDLRGEYMPWNRIGAALVLVLMPLSSYVWWQLFLLMSPQTGFSEKDGLFVLLPSRQTWAVAAALPGMVTGGVVTELVLKRILGERYPEFGTFRNLFYGFDARRALKGLYVLGGTLAVAALILISRWHAHFLKEEIQVHRLLQFGEYGAGYSNIASIKAARGVTAPNGNIVLRREYSIRFVDGFSWNTDTDLSDATPEQKARLIDAVSARSGVPVREVDVLTRDDLR